MSRGVNDEHPERRRDGYRPIVMSEDKTNMFADSVALARLRRESYGNPDTAQLERLAHALVKANIFKKFICFIDLFFCSRDLLSFQMMMCD
jgi:hypothetical protein